MCSARFLFVGLLLIGISSLTACRRASDAPSHRLVTSISLEGSPCESQFTYDDRQRLISASQCDTLETYTYIADTVIYTRMVEGLLSYQYIYLLNDKGIAYRYIKIDKNGAQSMFYIKYNSNGQRIQLIDSTHSGTSKTYTIESNNISKEVSTSTITTEGNYTITSTYYADTDNPLTYAAYGKSFLGRSSANIKKSDSYETPDGIYTLTYTYQLDNVNGIATRITKMNETVVELRYFEYKD